MKWLVTNMLNDNDDLIFMSPRVEREMLRAELKDWEEQISETDDEDLEDGYWEAKMDAVRRIAELERHMKFDDWRLRKLKAQGKYLKRWLDRHYGDHEDSQEMLEKYERVCDEWEGIDA